MTIEIKKLEKSEEKNWESFAEKASFSNYSFSLKYKKTLEETFGYEPEYFFLKKDNVIKGIFPSFNIRGSLVSMPFSIYGGILSEGLSDEEIDTFFKKIKLQYRSINFYGRDLKIESLFKKYIYNCGFLIADNENNLWGKIDRSIKKNIRKAEEFKLDFFEDNSQNSLEKYFYPAYLKEMKKFGTPPLPLKFFCNLLNNFYDKIKVMYVKNYQGLVVSALLGIGFGEIFYIAYNPSLQKFYYQRSNDFIHWEAIKRVFSNGYKYFDFGPMRYEGQTKFKKKWGIKERECYSFSTKKNFSGKDKKYNLLSVLWRLFMPLSLSKIIGPIIRKKMTN